MSSLALSHLDRGEKKSRYTRRKNNAKQVLTKKKAIRMKIGASFSVGKVAYAHDVRITRTKNVDTNLMSDNVTLLDKLNGRSIQDYTNERMRPAIERYNAKQKRKDREINETYCEYFYKQKNHGELCYEAVLQFGEHEDLGKEYYSPDTSPERKDEIKREYEMIYKTLLKVMKTKYPHLEILYAVIHFDEPNGTPHMHICYQGIGTNYSQGLDERVSIGNALTCDGIERVKSRLEAKELHGYQISRFYHEFRQKYFIPILKKNGYEIKEEQHGIEHQNQEMYSLLCELRKAYDVMKDYSEFLVEQGRQEYIKELNGIIAKSEAQLKENGLFNVFLNVTSQNDRFERFKNECRERYTKKTENALKAKLELPEEVEEAMEFVNRFTL